LRTELEGARSLAKEGYSARQRVLQLEADLAAAEAQLARIEEEISDTSVTAPYDGVVNEIAVEGNQYVTVGTVLATLIDNSILRVAVHVSQSDIANVELGRNARISFANGNDAIGRICFISARAEPKTRTFLTEVWVPNMEGDAQDKSVTPSGVSAEVRLPLGMTRAHIVSPAGLALDDMGRIGAKTLDSDNVVKFVPVQIERSGEDGVWISGLPPKVRLITFGQGFVQPGEKVRVGETDDAPPAATTVQEDKLGVPSRSAMDRLDTPAPATAAVAQCDALRARLNDTAKGRQQSQSSSGDTAATEPRLRGGSIP
jgi:membrane fusion protein, multidrug efflux system